MTFDLDHYLLGVFLVEEMFKLFTLSQIEMICINRFVDKFHIGLRLIVLTHTITEYGEGGISSIYFGSNFWSIAKNKCDTYENIAKIASRRSQQKLFLNSLVRNTQFSLAKCNTNHQRCHQHSKSATNSYPVLNLVSQ